MKRRDDRALQGLNAFCGITAAAVDLLCILYLTNIMQYHWFLNFILALAILLHIALMLLRLVKDKRLQSAVCAVLALIFLGALIYFNL